jgi:hypothetical protein
MLCYSQFLNFHFRGNDRCLAYLVIPARLLICYIKIYKMDDIEM